MYLLHFILSMTFTTIKVWKRLHPKTVKKRLEEYKGHVHGDNHSLHFSYSTIS